MKKICATKILSKIKSYGSIFFPYGLFAIFMTFFSLFLTCCPLNINSFISSIPYETKTSIDDVFGELSVINKTNSPDYYYLDYQFSFENYENFRDTYYSPQVFAFKTYGENIEENTNGSYLRNFYSTGLRINNELTILEAISAKLVNRDKIFLKDYFGIDFLYDSLNGYEKEYTCVLPYDVAIEILKEKNMQTTELNLLLGDKLVLENKVIEGNVYNVQFEIIGILKPFDEQCKLPIFFRNCIFISSNSTLRTPSKIYFKIPNNVYTNNTWIDGLFKNFNFFEGYSSNQVDFDLQIKYFNLSNIEKNEIFKEKTQFFNQDRISGYYSLLAIIFFVISIVLFLIFLYQIKVLKKNITLLKPIIIICVFFVSFAFSIFLIFLISMLLSQTTCFYLFGRFSSQIFLSMYVFATLFALIYASMKRRKEYEKRS